jgi:hypothetical protein
MDREELKRIVEQFAKEEYPSGELEMYADYRDELSPEQAFDIIESNHPWETFNDLLWDAYLDAEIEYIDDLEGEFDSWCENNGYDCTSEDLDLEGIYINEYISIVPPADHYLSQDINCRLIVDNGDGNFDFTHNPNQDNNFQIEEGAGIIWLGQQLGYSVEQMQAALDAGINSEEYPIDKALGEDKFLDSLIQEAANAYGLPALTFLCKMSLGDLIKFKEDHTSVTVDLNGANCGFFDAWNGGGSVLELDCGVKSITIPYDKIFTLIPDVRGNGQYSVDEVYGLTDWVYADAHIN